MWESGSCTYEFSLTWEFHLDSVLHGGLVVRTRTLELKILRTASL